MTVRAGNQGQRSHSVSTSASSTDGTNGNVKVVVRVRPENEHEIASNSKSVVKVLDENILIFDPNEDSTPSFFHGKRRPGRDLLKRKNKDMRFAFDQVFDADVSQQEVYEKTTKSIIDGVLNGYNCSVFAYGATGAGKTFTMLGSPNSPGVIFNTMVELYRRIEDIRDEKTCDVAVSYLEVYNENIHDLLLPGKTLAVREDTKKCVVVSGLSLHQPKSAQELLHMLEYGNSNRTQHPTDANAQSSRSHAVFQVFVRQKARTAGLSADVRVAKMSLIDLAGSERATVTTNRGARFREGANINKSLLALGNCINALANPKTKSIHIPYRNSKLTRLLKDSLGGNCRTVMIAAVSPSHLTYEDTYNTLKYANRAKEIKSTLKSNVVNVDFHVSKYAQIVKELRTEVSELKLKLKGYEDGSVKISNRRLSLEYTSRKDDVIRLQHSMLNIFIDRANIRKELMELESSDKDLTMKIIRKERNKERCNLIYVHPNELGKTTSKLDRVIAAAKCRQIRLRETKSKVDLRMTENEERVQRLEKEMALVNQDEEMPEILATTLRMRHLEIEIKDSRRQVKHLQKHVKIQDNNMQSSERLIHSLLTMVRKQYFILKGSGLATSDITEEFETIQRTVEGDKEVVWADEATTVDTSDVNTVLDFPVLSCVPATPNVSRTPGLRRLLEVEEDKLDNEVFSPVQDPAVSRLSEAVRVVKNDSRTKTGISAGRVLTPRNKAQTMNSTESLRIQKTANTAEKLNTPRHKAIPQPCTSTSKSSTPSLQPCRSIPQPSTQVLQHSIQALQHSTQRDRSGVKRRNTYTVDDELMNTKTAFSHGHIHASQTPEHNPGHTRVHDTKENLPCTPNHSSVHTPSHRSIVQVQTQQTPVHTVVQTPVHTAVQTPVRTPGKPGSPSYADIIKSGRTQSVSKTEHCVPTKSTEKLQNNNRISALPSLSRDDIEMDGICPLKSPILSTPPPSMCLDRQHNVNVAQTVTKSTSSLSSTSSVQTPSTPGGRKRSYAQVVCTPTPVRGSPRMPLSSIGNSPHLPSDCDDDVFTSPGVVKNQLNSSYSTNDKENKTKQINKENKSQDRRGTFSLSDENFSSNALTALRQPQTTTTEIRRQTIATMKVKKHGLASVIPHQQSSHLPRHDFGFRRPKPAYMMMTKAAASKRKHRR
ncbi:kinesin-like protein KIF18A [Glandiceps talaboti]